MMERVATLRILLAILFVALPSVSAQGERILSQNDGNFELRGTVRPALSLAVILGFRAQSGLGYQLFLSSAPGRPIGALSDPGRRSGLLAISEILAKPKMSFFLVVNGPRFRLEIDGQPAWEYVEKEAGVGSVGTVTISGPVQDLEFRALPATPPSFAERYGPSVGAKAPPIAALDQSGKPRDFASLAGPKGLWILFTRSADWCPFCKSQLVELSTQAAAIRKLGYGVAALSYDQPAALAHFANRRQIQYPLLSDPDSKVIDAFGIRNENIKDGFAKGVPHPGMFLIDGNGRIEAKYFEEDYRERITVSSILTGRFGERAPPAGVVIDRPRIRLTPTASATAVRGGQRLRLAVEAILGRGLHAYAPGAPSEFIPVSWTIGSTPVLKAGDPEWPKAETTQLFGFDEKVPNYTGSIRVTREITLAPQAVLTKEALAGELTIAGEFRYQACNDRVCFPPETVPVTWKLAVESHDRERVPKDMQRPER